MKTDAHMSMTMEACSSYSRHVSDIPLRESQYTGDPLCGSNAVAPVEWWRWERRGLGMVRTQTGSKRLLTDEAKEFRIRSGMECLAGMGEGVSVGVR